MFIAQLAMRTRLSDTSVTCECGEISVESCKREREAESDEGKCKKLGPSLVKLYYYYL